MIKAHPTTYGGVNFRSRLEARWAAFFDLLGWRWQYEPIDLEGWTPDFSIQGHDGPIYVEVKPIEWVGCHDLNRRQIEERADLSKVFGYCKRATAPREVLVLGTVPMFLTHKPDKYCSWGFLGGLLGSFAGDHDKADVDAACLFKPKTGFDFCAYYGSYHFRVSGEYDGDHHLHQAEINEDAVKAMWHQAANRVQWRARVPA